MKDVIIIGGGPAGFSAAIYAVRAGLNVQILEKAMWGGQAVNTPEIENYPGILKVSGAEFSMQLHNQASTLGVEVDNREVTRVELEGPVKKIYTGEELLTAKSVIIANGVSRRTLGCDGEKEYKGRGVSYCATCDGAFFRGKDVALVGGGNTAMEDALFLSNLCRKVYVIHRRENFRADKVSVEELQKRKNVEFVLNSVVEEIYGEDLVKGILVYNRVNQEKRKIDVQGIFIAIGYKPDNRMFEQQLELDQDGYFITDENCHTRIPGVYVAGDCRSKKLRQIVTAAADGAVAGFEAANYCNTMKE